MAVMVTFTLKSDVETYRSMHDQMLGLAIPAGMLFHSAYEVGRPSRDRGLLAERRRLAELRGGSAGGGDEGGRDCPT